MAVTESWRKPCCSKLNVDSDLPSFGDKAVITQGILIYCEGLGK